MKLLVLGIIAFAMLSAFGGFVHHHVHPWAWDHDWRLSHGDWQSWDRDCDWRWDRQWDRDARERMRDHAREMRDELRAQRNAAREEARRVRDEMRREMRDFHDDWR
jgi:hypothetical protein